MKVKLTDVKIGERLPRPMGDMEGMAQSIATYGLIQPIVLDDDFKLIAGFRRFTAHQMNGEVDIEAIFRKDIDPIMAMELELEENLQRENLGWREKDQSLAMLHKLKTDRDANWTQTKTQIAGGAARQSDVS